ncbi:hypothetical protein BH10ACT11_BH10ACT11_19270 [soil metagenome]
MASPDQPSAGRSDIANQLMKVIQLADFDRPHGGSFIPLLLGLFRVCQSRGHSCEVIFGSNTAEREWLDEFRAQGVEVTIAPPAGRNSRLSMGAWLSRHLDSHPGPTVLHTHFTTWDVPAMIAARGRDVTVVWHVHSAVSRRPWMVARTMVKFVLFGRRTSGILCPAPDIAQDVRRRLAPKSRVRFVPSALDMDRFPLLGPEARKEAKAALGLPVDALVLSHFGWHWHLKGNDIFLDAVAALVDRFPDLIAIDRGGDERMSEYAEELGLGDRFRLIAPVDDVQTVHGAADVMLSSSRQEGMAYAVLEALASGTPVVATAIPGHSYLAEHIDAIELTETSVSDVARGTTDVLSRDSELAAREAEQAHAWIAENLSTDAVGAGIADLYESSLPESSRRPSALTSTGSARPRLIHLCDYDNAHPGSFVPMIDRLLMRAAERGWDPEFVVIGDGADAPWARAFESRGLPVTGCPDASRTGITRLLRGFLSPRTGPMLLHTHFTRFDVPAVVATMGRADTRVVWHEHTAMSSEPITVARNVIKFGLMRRQVDKIYCPAPDLAREVVRRLGPRQRTTFLPNAIDGASFSPPSVGERAEARSGLGFGPESKVLLGFAWSWEFKGGELFQRAAAAMAAKDSGVGAIQLTEEAEATELAASLGIDAMLRIVKPTAAVRGLYAASDVFVAASRAEGGTPLAVLEALSCGLPVVASDIASHRFIAERVPGVLIVDRDPAAFAAGIEHFLALEPGSRAELVETSGRAIAQHFSLDRWCETILADYERLMA